VAYWNLHSRPIERLGAQFLAGGRPLAFFHFSGFDPRHPQTLSKHQTRNPVNSGSALAELLDLYADLHRARGHPVSSQWPYAHSQFSNGVPVNLVFRHLYLGQDEATRRRFGNPFHADGPGSFFAWATGSRPESGKLSPFLETLYRLRADLPPAFPDPTGKDRQAFFTWASSQGAREMDYPPEIIEDGGGAASSPAVEARPTLPGVNVAGYLRNETGLGAIARGYVRAMQSLGVPVALKDVSELSPNRSEDPTLTVFDDSHPHPVNLVCVNADQHFVVAAHLTDGFFRNRRNIAVWFWELPEFPEEWHDRFRYYDEIWVASSFIANTLAPVAPIPVVRMPPVLAGGIAGDRERGRARLRLDGDEFVWLFVFDFHSYFERKNPLALVEAFRTAFGPSEPVRLVIKCVNADFDAGAFRALRSAARGQRISIHDGYWSTQEMQDLAAACDGYASLHRSEGLGVPLADAMALGRPVVATGWSGNADFMNVGNSFPVRYELVKLPRDVGPYRAGRTWAEPSVAHAAELLRLVFEGGEEITARGLAGKRTIETEFSVEAVARYLERRLTVIRSEISGATPPLAPGDRPIDVSSRYDSAPAPPPLDLRTGQRGLLSRVAQQAIRLLLRDHTFQQQRVNAILNSSIGDLTARLRTVSDRVEQSLRIVHDELGGVTPRISGLESRLNRVSADLERLERVAAERQQTAAGLAEAHEALGTLGSAVEELKSRTGGAEGHDAAARLEELAARVAHIGYRFSVRPYMGVDAFGANGDLSQAMGYGPSAADPESTLHRESFEDLFRGPEEFIAERQRCYLPLLEGVADIVDLGCGRGEFLGILATAGRRAVGVEKNPVLVARGRARGLDVVEADALQYLRHQPEASLGAVFSAQFIEHLSPEELPELLALSHSRLRKDGLFIAETPNPECFEALKTFHVDLTHHKPLHPQVLLFLCREQGFSSARIFYPLGGGFTQQQYEFVGEYAVVAVR
jgi:SAM-dependent methyltransferase/glycosyltransferase involved in cell wall biosynthesis